MDLHEARERHGEPMPEASAGRRTATRRRAADARLRRAIRDALAQRQGMAVPPPDATPQGAERRLRVVRDDRG